MGAQRVDIKARTDANGAGLVIEVRDYGSGIAPEVVNRLFEPFLTTKPSGSGLGLGLALSLGIVRGFGGDISARNVEGGGAVFCVKLHSP